MGMGKWLPMAKMYYFRTLFWIKALEVFRCWHWFPGPKLKGQFDSGLQHRTRMVRVLESTEQIVTQIFTLSFGQGMERRKGG